MLTCRRTITSHLFNMRESPVMLLCFRFGLPLTSPPTHHPDFTLLTLCSSQFNPQSPPSPVRKSQPPIPSHPSSGTRPQGSAPTSPFAATASPSCFHQPISHFTEPDHQPSESATLALSSSNDETSLPQTAQDHSFCLSLPAASLRRRQPIITAQSEANQSSLFSHHPASSYMHQTTLSSGPSRRIIYPFRPPTVPPVGTQSAAERAWELCEFRRAVFEELGRRGTARLLSLSRGCFEECVPLVWKEITNEVLDKIRQTAWSIVSSVNIFPLPLRTWGEERGKHLLKGPS